MKHFIGKTVEFYTHENTITYTQTLDEICCLNYAKKTHTNDTNHHQIIKHTINKKKQLTRRIIKTKTK